MTFEQHVDVVQNVAPRPRWKDQGGRVYKCPGLKLDLKY
jgi:hypothetical protein